MSGSKYSDVRLSEEAARRVREENRRRVKERAAQRAAEAERRREEQLRQKQAAFNRRLAEGKKEVAAFESTPASRHVATSLQELRARLERMGETAFGNEKQLARAERQLYQIRRELKRKVSQAKAAQDAQDLKQEAAIVLRWKYQAAEDRQGSRQFDPAGLAQFEAALRSVEGQLARRNLEGARRAMAEVGQQFKQHRAEVERRRGLWLTQKRAGEAALARVQDRIGGLESDPVVQRWQAAAMADISERAAQLTEMIEYDQFQSAAREAENLLAESEQVLEAAEARQRCQESQDYIAESTVAALQTCGFYVDVISQSPQGGSNEVLIRAHRLDGRALAVSVPREGAIQWSVDGFPIEIVAGANGQPAAVCDEAVDQIEAIQNRLDDDYGIETSALTWAGQDPNRPRKAAKARPRHTQQYSRRAFGARRE
ncbi:MAG: hypothetical protein ACQESR_03845 [Planctomycetota bacterium]